MHGIAFFLNIAFALFLLWASGMALYMGIFRAGGADVALPRKIASGAASLLAAAVAWFFMYSWTYIGW
jgi:hypothetical protein